MPEGKLADVGDESGEVSCDFVKASPGDEGVEVFGARDKFIVMGDESKGLGMAAAVDCGSYGMFGEEREFAGA